MEHQTKPITGLLLAGLLASNVAAAQGNRIDPVLVHEPPAMARIASHLIASGSGDPWWFTAVTLQALLDAYAEELDRAALETPSTPARRAKLARWRSATRGLIGRLEDAQTRLGQGAAFSIQVDPRHQIVLLIDGQPIVVSGPRGGTESAISARVERDYCAYQDCSMLDDAAADAIREMIAAAGNWVLSQRRPPAYEIGDQLRCKFADIADRERKARTCAQLHRELQELLTGLQRANGRGYRIDWPQLALVPAITAPRVNVVVNGVGDYLPMTLPLLRAAGQADWASIRSWLQRMHAGDPHPLVITGTERYLTD